MTHTRRGINWNAVMGMALAGLSAGAVAAFILGKKKAA